MQIDTFKREFRQLNGVTLEDSWVLFRKPLQLFNLETGESVIFKDLDEALRYELAGKTLEQQISKWTSITFRLDGGRGSGSGLSTFSFSHASPGGGDKGKPDLPARMNTRLGVNRTPDDALRAFRDAHVADGHESGVTVDEQGYITQYVHGTAHSVAIWGRKGEMVYHNHPGGGNFSDSDLISVSMTAAKGIVASGRSGDYKFVKTHKFKSNEFAIAVKSARMQGKDYDDAADRWLKANQRKYGYTYSFTKAK